MGPSAPPSTTVLEALDHLWPPATPVTTSEVAEEFDCTQRAVHSKLESLVDDDVLNTKRVGANSRVWWRPVEPERERREGSYEGRAQIRPHPVFDSEMVGVIVWDADGTIVDANDAFLGMAGLDYDEALGTSWRDLSPEEFYRAGERHLSEVEESGSGVPYEKQYYHADGSRWWGLFESRRLNDDEKVEFVIDISERRDVEEAVREREVRLDAFVTATSDVVYRMSPDWSEMYYLEGQEFVRDTKEPRATWLEEYIPEDERERVTRAIEEALETTSTFELEHQVVQVDGTRGWTQSRAVPILDDDGEITEWFGTATDITERKQYERMLERQNVQLELLKKFTDALSHDLRSPLSVIGGRLHLYRETGEPEYLDAIETTIGRMEQLVEDLLRAARSGQVVEDPDPTPISDVLETAREGTLPESATCEYDPVRTLMADPDRLVQVFENLLGNSADHGGEDVTVRVGPLEDGFYVEDDGPGVPEAARELMFEHGYTTREDGMGYGLSIVRSIVDAHGWDIAVTESEDGGARFEITGVDFANDR